MLGDCEHFRILHVRVLQALLNIVNCKLSASTPAKKLWLKSNGDSWRLVDGRGPMARPQNSTRARVLMHMPLRARHQGVGAYAHKIHSLLKSIIGRYTRLTT